ncbi:bifunctional serine/threonine-protein kinase/ABC transporter substrate-binding protein [Streptomyces zagrosensis]|uniref:ABC-type branched-subunit amino acid transport system substrate-binding protein n=1 Tax=Streptomyces zagrosensis TaxID=1042984 RepID=A0A7W9V1I8_9ACTN|nr:bifunctional serine/threonine-protein kinase/ABC transporter substrate-binding protein [Streptomyces zagrosensis]MBB5937844.1 ABC-type branched-subunit amino acid transport system substrate-binding protein [Streptomyces zagrosensis]
MQPLRSADPSRIADHRIMGRLGAGGMGVVYVARSPGGELLAVKVIHPEHANDHGFRARFRREVAAARKVSSRWAVPVIDADTDADAPWLASAYIAGPALGEAVAAHGPLPPDAVRALGTMLAEALESVHAVGLVHRDLKPGNVLLALDGPRLIDFGIARALDDTVITTTDMVIGSPGYLSPEQAQAAGAAIGPPSDVFSLGCVLAYAACGRPPFGTGDAPAMLYRTVHDPAGLAGAPEDLLPLLERCLAKDAGLRPTAAEVRRELADGHLPDGGGDWLPEHLVHLVATRSAAMLALPDIEPTAVSTAPPPDEGPPADEAAPASVVGATSRRRLFAIVGGAVLAAGGGFAAWATLRDDEGQKEASNTSGLPVYAIGLHAALSGAHAPAGNAQRTGAQLAIDQFNARRNKRFELRLETADDGGRQDRASATAAKLVADRSVLAVIGTTTDDTAIEAVEVYDEALLAMLGVSLGNQRPSGVSTRSLLLTRPSDARHALPIGPYLSGGTKTRRTGLIDDRTADNYSWMTTRAVAGALQALQHPVVPRVLRSLSTDYRPIVRSLLDQRVDSIVFGGGAHGAAEVARELQRAGFTGPKLATQAVVDPLFLKEAGGAAEGWLLTSTFIDPVAKPEAARFTAAYRKRFNATPPATAVEAYDAANLLLRTIEELVGDAPGKSGGTPSTSATPGAGPESGPPTRKALLARLRTAQYDGISKKIAFTAEDGEYGLPGGTFFYEVKRGRFVFIGDAAAGTA